MQRSIYLSTLLSLFLIGCAQPNADAVTEPKAGLPQEHCLQESFELEQKCTYAKVNDLSILGLERCGIYRSDPIHFLSYCDTATLISRMVPHSLGLVGNPVQENLFFDTMERRCNARTIGRLTIKELQACIDTFDYSTSVLSEIIRKVGEESEMEE